MAQSGDVKFGNSNSKDFNLSLAGTGGSEMPDLKAEFSDVPHDRGVLSAARSSDPNSANSHLLFAFNPLLIWIGSIQFLEKLLREWNLLIKSKKVMVQMALLRVQIIISLKLK